MINLSTEYPGQVEAPDASYPQGGAKNESAPGNFDGTPFEKAVFNDLLGLQQSLVKMAGITPSGTADNASTKTSSEQLQAILHAVLGANTFDESGAADAYVLDVVDNNPAPANYSSNMNVVFTPGNTNTGASTIDVEGLGVESIRLNGVALVGGELVAGVRTTLVYDSVNGWFELITQEGKLVQEVNIQTGAVATGTTIIPKDDTIPQNTEGDEYMQLSITPKAVTNKLIIDVVFNCAHSGTLDMMSGALFQDAVVNAIASGWTAKASLANAESQVILRHIMLAGTVAATTFKFRAGADTAGTTTFNGRAGGRIYGDSMASNMSIKEITP